MRLDDGTSLYALFVLSILCPLLLCMMVRPLAPAELPVLRLSKSEVAAVIAQDARAAAQAPRTPAALELERLFLENGEAEVNACSRCESRETRVQQLNRAYSRLKLESGEAAALTLRSRAVLELEAALAGQLPEERRPGVLGVFANALAVHFATDEGVELAPHFVTRTLYKVRWNLALGLPVDHALAKVEQRAFHGFLALHAENLPDQVRVTHLTRYAAAGGVDAAEALGVLKFRGRDPRAAVAALEHADRTHSNLRIHNYLAGARIALGTPPTPSGH